MNSVLLQTARALVYDPETCARLRMLLDGGSQRSYMTEHAKKMLKLDPDSERQLSIAEFGSSRGGPKIALSSMWDFS